VATFSFSTDAPAQVAADVLVLPVFEGPEPGPGVREAGGPDLLGAYADAKLTGKRGESLLVPNLGLDGVAARSIMLLGVGPRDDVSPDALRRAIGRVAFQLAKRESVATTLPQAAGRSTEDAIQAVVEGLLLGSYRFTEYKSGKTKDAPQKPALKRVTVIGSGRWDAAAAKAALARAQVVSDAVAWARDLVNMPAIDCTPAFLAKQAQAMAKDAGLECKVWTEAELKKGGFGGILGVGAGSANPPRLIELRYRGAGARDVPIALTGKGISFDSGGLSIKPADSMEWMKSDMGGAASILATMRAIATLKPKINVIAAIPSAENMPGGTAIRPGDVLRHRNGKTSEVLNTDAEGRLILADALAYLSEQKPRVIIDTATLTGACMIALGEEIFGVMGNDRGLIRDIVGASEQVGEQGWELPLWQGYRRLIDSEVADIKNIGKRYGGAITAALFLSEFVDGVPWAHLDIAGPAFADKAGDYWPKGGTGVPVRTLVRYVLTQADGAGRAAAPRSRARARATR
jgi:leucyl aminopeptidase